VSLTSGASGTLDSPYSRRPTPSLGLGLAVTVTWITVITSSHRSVGRIMMVKRSKYCKVSVIATCGTTHGRQVCTTTRSYSRLLSEVRTTMMALMMGRRGPKLVWYMFLSMGREYDMYALADLGPCSHMHRVTSRCGYSIFVL
jgi:hypothetical protein